MVAFFFYLARETDRNKNQFEVRENISQVDRPIVFKSHKSLRRVGLGRLM